MLGDVSLFKDTMTEADAIFMQEALREKIKIETERQYVMLDVRFLLFQMANLSPEGRKFLPSHVHAMEKNLMGD